MSDRRIAGGLLSGIVLVATMAVIALCIVPSGSVAVAAVPGAGQSAAPVFIRIIKDESILEVWARDGARYRLVKAFAVCQWSGRLGPKVKEGDGQSPEGFYVIRRSQMNPHSHYDRAFNIGFPNAFDRANSRTGSDLMVHGGCGSAGCYAMSDPRIEAIYGLMSAAFSHGQAEIPGDILPFRPTPGALAAHAGAPWGDFWRTLAEGEAVFDRTGRPATVYVCHGNYAFNAAPGCARIRRGG